MKLAEQLRNSYVRVFWRRAESPGPLRPCQCASEPGDPPVCESVIQKFTPSLQAPSGPVLAPVEKEPMGVKSAAFQSETLSPPGFVTRTRCPSRAAARRAFNPLPVSVWRTAPLEARTDRDRGRDVVGDPDVRPIEDGERGVSANRHGLNDGARRTEFQESPNDVDVRDPDVRSVVDSAAFRRQPSESGRAGPRRVHRWRVASSLPPEVVDTGYSCRSSEPRKPA